MKDIYQMIRGEIQHSNKKCKCGRDGDKVALSPYYIPKDSDNTLVFESRFESGNLKLAMQVRIQDINIQYIGLSK